MQVGILLGGLGVCGGQIIKIFWFAQILGGLVLVLLPAVLATLPCRKESQDNDDGDK